MLQGWQDSSIVKTLAVKPWDLTWIPGTGLIEDGHFLNKATLFFWKITV